MTTVALRTLPIVIDVPVQLPLALVHEQPIERRARHQPDPEPIDSAQAERIEVAA